MLDRLKRLLHTESVEEKEPAYCQDCGRIIFWDMHGWDDVASEPYITESCDLFCVPCGREQDRADREDNAGSQDPEDWGAD